VIAVIFEATPGASERDEYLAIAASLRPLLDGVDGFISIERFGAILRDYGKCERSFWRDEEAVARWRGMEEHRAAQAEGRARIFADYRLRIGAILRDYGKCERAQAPADSRAVNG
jgi:heme-degrading monooxygenase HmoA